MMSHSNYEHISPSWDHTRLYTTDMGEGWLIEAQGGELLLSPTDVPISRKFSPLVIMFIGRRGQGKSLAMSTLAYYMQQRYRATGAPFNVLSNYWMSFGDMCDPELVDKLLEDPFIAENSLIAIDELSTAVPSRRSLSDINTTFARFLEQIRKLRCEMMFATQFPQVLDYQTLLQVDLFLKCELIGNGKGVKFYIFDYWGQFTGRDYRKPWPPMPGTHDDEMVLWGTHNLFGHYKTGEYFAPVWKKELRQRVMGRYWEEVPDEAEDENGQVAIAAKRKEPRNLEEWVAQQEGEFAVNAALTWIKRDNPKANGNSAKPILEALGCEVYRNGTALIARRKE